MTDGYIYATDDGVRLYFEWWRASACCWFPTDYHFSIDCSLWAIKEPLSRFDARNRGRSEVTA